MRQSALGDHHLPYSTGHFFTPARLPSWSYMRSAHYRTTLFWSVVSSFHCMTLFHRFLVAPVEWLVYTWTALGVSRVRRLVNWSTERCNASDFWCQYSERDFISFSWPRSRVNCAALRFYRNPQIHASSRPGVPKLVITMYPLGSEAIGYMYPRIL